MQDQVKIDLEQLKTAANSLKNENNKIIDIYNKDVTTILENSYDVINKHGINYEEYCESIYNLFKLLDESMSDLANVLSNSIIPKYENVSEDIKILFNNNFADEITSLLMDE